MISRCADFRKSLRAGALAAIVMLSGVRVARCEGVPPARIAAAVSELIKSSKAPAGVSLVDLRSGKAILGVNENDLFAPASNQKVLTGAFALARLGGDYKFLTRACLAGKDVWVLGSGDPTLGDSRLAEEANESAYAELDRWSAAIAKALPGGIEGDLVVCRAFRADQRTPQESYRPRDWPSDQAHTWYCAPAAALNFNNNCVDVAFTLAGGKITPAMTPASRYIQVVNRIQPGAKHAWGGALSQGDSVLTLTGSATASHTKAENVPVNNPPLFFGRALAERLAQAGVKFNGKIADADAPPAGWESWKELARTSTPLATVLRRTNKHSLNMGAECLFLAAGDGTWAGSAELMAQTLRKEYGVEPNAVLIRDGSGLSHEDRATPAAMTAVLGAAVRRKDAMGYLQSFPFSGLDGTLKGRLSGDACRGRVLGKTGYITGVSCLSGYVLDRENRPAVAFSILCNGVASAGAGKSLQDDICSLLVDWLDGRGK
jgi:serine-type D-Ala-D-Ala carboxypeptidase/endopeptidase (penicillin-binding protein 4)